MKKIILIALMLVSVVTFAKGEPQLEVVGQSVKATYYYDNGNVQQVGFFKDGKLDGKWTSYAENGTIQTIAEYTNGVKSGVWKYFDNSIATKEVSYSNNTIVSVTNLKPNFVAGN
ncbi:membrane-binding protein [Flavobacterium sp.]|uniref:toxin-antitoxin system YwqK family antitoxin n=1 Tax=Flavobacterium sp. TaxID=239 RepID=UPI00260FF617|nr:membrane-binding protein [Flavobacterium sp.]